MKSNIQLVAKCANVSVSTVSRVLNNHPSVSPETREKITNVMKELNYEPNKLARGLSTDGFDAILIVYTRSSKNVSDNPYFNGIITAIGTVTEDYDFDMILLTCTDEQKEIERAMTMVKSKLIKGIILLSARTNSKFIETIEQTDVPMVVIGKIDPSIKSKRIISVDTDNFLDCKEMGKYLIGMGHKSIGIIHSPKSHYVAIDRVMGFSSALSEGGISFSDEDCFDGGYSLESSYQAALKLLCTKKYTAILTTDDMKALAVYKAAKNLGLKIPDDISIAGHNDYEYSALLSPSLTTIRVPIYELGFVGATKLLRTIKTGENSTSQLLPTELFLRNSVRNLNNT